MYFFVCLLPLHTALGRVCYCICCLLSTFFLCHFDFITVNQITLICNDLISGSVNDVHFHPTARLVCSAAGDGSAHVWHVPPLAQLHDDSTAGANSAIVGSAGREYVPGDASPPPSTATERADSPTMLDLSGQTIVLDDGDDLLPQTDDLGAGDDVGSGAHVVRHPRLELIAHTSAGTFLFLLKFGHIVY